MSGRGRRLQAQRLDETCENEDEKSYESGDEAIDTKRLYDECLYESEIERSDNADKRDSLEYATQEPVEDDELKCGENKKNTEEKDAIFGERNIEETRILARGDYVTTGEILDIAEKRCAAGFLLGEIRGICEPEKG